jgi:stage II sporulation protein AA (anti-sigma F factor antagonist)
LQKIEGSTVIDIEGEIDMASSPLIAKALDQAVHEENSDVVLNARDLFYIDSSGIQILVSAGRRLADDGRRLFVVGCHGIFYKLVQVMRLDSEFCLYPDLKEALSAINPDKASD